ncbi:MAG: Coenzyme F420 hydrogenase/dehydrogenase, beta subunit C-terminal domain [Bacillota bacterium]
MPGQEQLKTGVIEKGLCSGCGMCVDLCPYIKAMRDRVGVINPCGIKEGTCYMACPKAGLDVSRMDSLVFGAPRVDQALGVFKDIYFARAVKKPAGGQYGGVASGLMAFALDRGLAGGAVVTGGDALNPGPVLAKSGREVLECAGSRYTAAPTLAALNRAVREGEGKLGLVGRPCQVEAVRKLQQAEVNEAHGAWRGSVVLTVGLFCFWSLDPGFYDFLSERAGGEEILRVDIPVEGLTITTSGGSRTWPVDEIRQYIKGSCNSCVDCTAEWADLSVGSTEYDPAWNTLVVRSDAGRSLVDDAAAEGVIEIKPYPADRLPILRKAALNKKMRVLAGEGRPDYLSIDGSYMDEMKKQWEVLQ